jgi:hypothetical protein
MKTTLQALAFAAIAATTTLAVAWPRVTLADPDDDRMGEWTDDGTKFGDVLVKGELVHDTHARSGWRMVITAENKGDAPASAVLESDLTRQMVNPQARVSPEAAKLWKNSERITLAAHAKTTVTRDVPAWIAQQLDNTAKVDRAREKAQKEFDKAPEKAPPAVTATVLAPYNVFAVGFLKQNA